jgi:hypothetical protein
MAKNPIWRTTVAALSGTVDSQFQRLLDSDAAVVAVGIAHTVQRDVAKRTERASSRLWHVLNLPTSSDVNRLFAQLGSVEREIRVLEKRIGDTVVDSPNGTSARPDQEVTPGAKPPRSAGGARPRPS